MIIVILLVIYIVVTLGFALLYVVKKTEQNLDEENYPDVEHEKAK